MFPLCRPSSSDYCGVSYQHIYNIKRLIWWVNPAKDGWTTLACFDFTDQLLLGHRCQYHFFMLGVGYSWPRYSLVLRYIFIRCATKVSRLFSGFLIVFNFAHILNAFNKTFEIQRNDRKQNTETPKWISSEVRSL